MSPHQVALIAEITVAGLALGFGMAAGLRIWALFEGLNTAIIEALARRWRP